jgi:amicoumacin kinase
VEKAIRDRFNDTILQETMARYAIRPGAIEELGGFESFIYGFSRADGDYILRIGHSRRRSANLIRGEVDWINYLAAGGAGVARAIDSANGRLVEEVDDGQGGHFLATAFVRARGDSPWAAGRWNEALFVDYGRLLGRIHALSRDYSPADPAWRRPEWDERSELNIADILPAEDAAVRDRFLALMAYLQALPKGREVYGLIHQDAHAGNFFVDEDGRITLFDFDDCVYGHYVYDLAMVLFYAVTNRPDAAEFGPAFFSHFMRGYRQETDIDRRWLAEIPHFLKLREIDLYAICRRDADQLAGNAWVENYMRGRRERLIDDVPYLEMEFDCGPWTADRQP